MSLSKARFNETHYDQEQSLMCAANGCPNRYSVDFGKGRLCSWHDKSEPHLWPQITQEQLDYVADMARKMAEPKPASKKLNHNDKVALLNRMRQALKVVR
jgi:hypothetical protein